MLLVTPNIQTVTLNSTTALTGNNSTTALTNSSESLRSNTTIVTSPLKSNTTTPNSTVNVTTIANNITNTASNLTSRATSSRLSMRAVPQDATPANSSLSGSADIQTNDTTSSKHWPPIRPVQLERLPSNNVTIKGTQVVNASTQTLHDSSILVRVGPLGSCFRNSKRVEICTSSDLQAHYNFTELSIATYDTTSLPISMSTYAVVLLVLVVTQLIKILAGGLCIFAPDSLIPASVSSLSSGWQICVNWLGIIIAIILAAASGIMRNKMSSVVNSFNSANQMKMLDSTPLLAQTGNSFGFIWIAVLLLFAAFISKRFANKRQAATDRAKQQILLERSHGNQESIQMQEQSRKGAIRSSDLEATVSERYPNRASGFGGWREALGMSRSMGRNVEKVPVSNHNISLPTYVLDDYVRRHLYAQREESKLNGDQLPIVPNLGYMNDDRWRAKDSPPFSSYHKATFDREELAKEQGQYIEELRQRMASPAPSYWTMSDKAQGMHNRKEKERIYMAELRRQRSTQS